jgi:hypothetical protein
MKRVFRIAVALALLVTVTVPAVALAAPGESAAPFQATYDDETVWTCTGVRIVKGDVVKDEEVCRLSGDTSWVIPGTYTGDPVGDVPPFDTMWGSDYDGATATFWTFKVAGNGNGIFTVRIVAYRGGTR